MTRTGQLIDDLLRSDLADDPTRSAASEPQRATVTARRRRQWGKDASLAAVTLGAVSGFLALTQAIGGDNGSRFDRAVVRGIGRGRHPVLNRVAQGISFFGGVPGAVAVSLGAIALVRKRPRLAAQVAVGALGGIGAELVLKRLFRRKRPTLLSHLEHVSSSSFPSGHSMASASLYLTLAFVASRSRRLRGHRRALLAGAGALATTIGATRVFLGVHWPTDVLGGLALGTAWACASEAAFDVAAAGQLERAHLAGPPALVVPHA